MIDQSKYKICARDRLFFDTYSYAVSTHVRFSHYIRYLDHGRLDHHIHARSGFWTDTPAPNGPDIKYLHELIDIMVALPKNHRRQISWNTLDLYTNDIESLAPVLEHPAVTIIKIREANVCLPRDTVCLEKSSHGCRSFLRDQTLTTSQKSSLRSFLTNYEKIWRLSPSLGKAIEKNDWEWCRRHWFFDHSSTKDLLFLELSCPGLIRKTLPIKAQTLG